MKEMMLVLSGLKNVEVIDLSPISDATALIEWLKENYPTNEDELDNLVQMIRNGPNDKEVCCGGYVVHRRCSELFVKGRIGSIQMGGNKWIEYLVELLEGVRIEMEGSISMKLSA